MPSQNVTEVCFHECRCGKVWAHRVKADSDIDQYVKPCPVCRTKAAQQSVTVPPSPEVLIPIAVPDEDEDFAEELPEPLITPRAKVVPLPEEPFSEDVPTAPLRRR